MVSVVSYVLYLSINLIRAQGKLGGNDISNQESKLMTTEFSLPFKISQRIYSARIFLNRKNTCSIIFYPSPYFLKKICFCCY